MRLHAAVSQSLRRQAWDDLCFISRWWTRFLLPLCFLRLRMCQLLVWEVPSALHQAEKSKYKQLNLKGGSWFLKEAFVGSNNFLFLQKSFPSEFHSGAHPGPGSLLGSAKAFCCFTVGASTSLMLLARWHCTALYVVAGGSLKHLRCDFVHCTNQTGGGGSNFQFWHSF